MIRKGFFLTILLIFNNKYKEMQSFSFMVDIFMEYHTNIDYDNGSYYKMGIKVVRL
jgi:hypothetical protein